MCFRVAIKEIVRIHLVWPVQNGRYSELNTLAIKTFISVYLPLNGDLSEN